MPAASRNDVNLAHPGPGVPAGPKPIGDRSDRTQTPEQRAVMPLAGAKQGVYGDVRDLAWTPGGGISTGVKWLVVSEYNKIAMLP